jgi:hypothetical protein
MRVLTTFVKVQRLQAVPRFAILVISVLGLGSCAFAQKHPGVTIGIVAGTMGFGTCELAVEKAGTCAIVGGAAGGLIGGITGLVTLLADTNAHDLPSDDVDENGISRRRRVEPPPGPYLPPEPNPLPPSASPAPPVVPPAAPGDAGVAAPDTAPASGSASP